MPDNNDNNNPNIEVLLESNASLEARIQKLEAQLKEVVDFNRRLLNHEKPAVNVNNDVENAKKKLDAYIGG